MSSSNIYNILSKLNALQPKTEETAPVTKPIYESVESRGSIMSGVAGIEKKLSEAYVAEKAVNKYAVGMSQAMKSTGDTPPLKKSTITKAHDIAKKVKEGGQPMDTNPKNADWDADAIAKQKARIAREKQKMGMQRKISGQDTGLPPAMDEGMAEDAATVKYGVFSKGGSIGSQRFKDEPLKTFDSKEEAIADAKRRRSGLSKGERGYYRMSYVVKAIKDVAEGFADMEADVKRRDAERRSGKKDTATGVKHHGKYGTEYQGDADEEEAAAKAADKGPKKRGRPAKGTAKAKPTTGEKKGRGRPKKAAEPTYSGAKDLQSFFGSTAPKKSKVRGTVHKMDEGRMTHMMDESSQHLDHILNRFKHEVKNFEQTGELGDGDLYHALYDYYCDSGEMPYGVAKARDGDPVAWISDRLEDELGLSEEAAPVAGQPLPGLGQGASNIDATHAAQFKPGSNVLVGGRMPAVIKSVTGTTATVYDPKNPAAPYNIDTSKLQAAPAVAAPAVAAPAPTMETELNELAKLAGLSVAEGSLQEHGDPWEDPKYDPRGGGETRSPEQIAKDNAEHEVLSKKLGLKNTNKLPDIKDDMLKMMNHFRSQHPKKKDVPEGEQDVAEDDEQLAEGACDKCDCSPCECNEGNAFGAAIAKAKSDGVQPGEKVQVGGKSYAVKEAEEMINFMRNAGLDTSRAESALAEAYKYGDTDVEEAPEYANSPDEEIENVQAITRQGNDLNREKKQFAGKPKAGDNPMASESADPLESMGRRLMAAYESIKIVDEGMVDKVKGMFGKKEKSDNVFQEPAVKADTKAYLKKSAKQPNGPDNVKNIFDK